MGNKLPFVFQVDGISLSGGKVTATFNAVDMPMVTSGRVEFTEITLQRTEFHPEGVVTVEPVEFEMSQFCPTCFVPINMFATVTMEEHLSVNPICRMENLHDE